MAFQLELELILGHLKKIYKKNMEFVQKQLLKVQKGIYKF